MKVGIRNNSLGLQPMQLDETEVLFTKVTNTGVTKVWGMELKILVLQFVRRSCNSFSKISCQGGRLEIRTGMSRKRSGLEIKIWESLLYK